MESLNQTEMRKYLQELLDARQFDVLLELLQEMPVVEVSEFIEQQEDDEVIYLLSMFEPSDRGVIFSDLDEDLQWRLFKLLGKKEFAEIFTHMHSDVRADLYQEFSKEEQISLLPYLSKKIREDVISLSAYPPETAGGIMHTDFATIMYNMTIRQAISKIRKDSPSKKMVYYIYVVDDNMRMLGFVTLKDLVLADPDSQVAEEINENFIFADVNEDRESVARKIERYDLLALPILNSDMQLVGIISHDDALDVIRAEHTEDLEKFMGIVPGQEGLDYLETNAWQHFRKRVVWLVGLAAVGIVSGIIVHAYEDALSALLILALYMPMLADTGGNTGSQAATVVIRAMALNQVSLKHWFNIVFKEARIGFMLALCLGALAFGKIIFLSYETPIPAELSLLKIATVISGALSLQVISATIIGSSLPLIVRRFGGDPAVAASPAITTIVDITGLLIYFGITTTFLLR